MRRRDYNPSIARFVNADPIGFASDLNWYQYAAGDPLSLADPSEQAKGVRSKPKGSGC